MQTPQHTNAIVEIIDSGCDSLVVITTSKGTKVRMYFGHADAEAYASTCRSLPYTEPEETPND